MNAIRRALTPSKDTAGPEFLHVAGQPLQRLAAASNISTSTRYGAPILANIGRSRSVYARRVAGAR